MPMKLRLEFMAIVCTDGFNPEREFIDNIVNEINGTGLRVSVIDFEGSDTGTVINGGVLITFDTFSSFVFEKQEFNIYLNVVPRYAFFISLKLAAGT